MTPQLPTMLMTSEAVSRHVGTGIRGRFDLQPKASITIPLVSRRYRARPRAKSKADLEALMNCPEFRCPLRSTASALFIVHASCRSDRAGGRGTARRLASTRERWDARFCAALSGYRVRFGTATPPAVLSMDVLSSCREVHNGPAQIFFVHHRSCGSHLGASRPWLWWQDCHLRD